MYIEMAAILKICYTKNCPRVRHQRWKNKIALLYGLCAEITKKMYIQKAAILKICYNKICPRVRTPHPPGIIHRDPKDDKSREKKQNRVVVWLMCWNLKKMYIQIVAILKICYKKNCPRVRTPHPPGIIHRDPKDDKSTEKKT